VAGVEEEQGHTRRRAKGKHEDEIARLKADNERLRAEGGNLFTGKSSVDDILKVLIDTVSSRKFAEVIKRGFELAIEYDYLSKEADKQAKENARAKLKEQAIAPRLKAPSRPQDGVPRLPRTAQVTQILTLQRTSDTMDQADVDLDMTVELGGHGLDKPGPVAWIERLSAP
jgi:hypothetical protein